VNITYFHINSWLYPCRSVKQAIQHLKYVSIAKYFSVRDWKYHNSNVRSLLGKLTPEDRDIFNSDIKQLNWNEYIETCVKGVRQHILKDDMSTLPFARKRYQK
jgi:fatty acyl-CoA reductase